MFTVSKLLLDNGLLDQPVILIEPHRNHFGTWRIKFSYDQFEPLSMNAEQATELAGALYGIGQDEMASEIDEAVKRARHYESM